MRGKVLQLREIIEDVEERLGPDVDLPMDMQKAFRMLERWDVFLRTGQSIKH